MTVSALPTPPARSDPSTFADRGDAFLGALPQFGTELNAVQVDVNAKQLSANNSAISATDSATTASNAAISALASKSGAEAASNAILWVSGTTYSSGTVQYSPIDFKSYRRKTTGSGTTDPSLDPTNYVPISNGAVQFMQVRDERTVGASGMALSPLNTRVLNTVVKNTIPGASLASNQVTLTAGTYYISANAVLALSVTASGFIHSRLAVYNVTDSVNLLVGYSNRMSPAVNTDSSSVVNCSGMIVLTSTKTISMTQYLNYSAGYTAFGGTPAGNSSGSTVPSEVYANLEIWKLV